MKSNSIWTKLVLLTLTSVFALHISVASANDDSTVKTTSSGDEECVIKDDQG